MQQDPCCQADSVLELLEVILAVVWESPRQVVLNIHAKVALGKTAEDFVATMATTDLFKIISGPGRTYLRFGVLY